MGKVVCLGSINVDIVATLSRFPRPGETVIGSTLARHPGGKGANQAIAAARMGAVTIMAGAAGDDESGRWMRDVLQSAGVDARHVALRSGVPTGTAIIRVCDGENDIVVIPGANETVDDALAAALPLDVGDVLLCQFEIPRPVVRNALQLARARGAIAILNAAPALPDAAQTATLADVLIVNETELAWLCGRTFEGDAPVPTIAGAGVSLCRGATRVVLATIGSRGVVVARPDGWAHVPGHAVEVVDTTGAGDCFCGALAAGLAQGAPMDRAVLLANAAAALAVTRAGAGSSMPLRSEVEAFAA